ncbi:CPBP family glutamic-type intramembrane protease [Cryobacterium sp. PH29-G1]|uniref:CPBP family glutamic-type intramembrane protease n=1 Tax=Cryobacterium sp. PH29-G1 TaxID=3046211 RepID=UPI0024B8B1D1|nr:CPBP family glutamic-type intramembrane protease [Cryobacterium sp. PH29-G1]MDJ0351055.1 CPBP family glutamic-type intramembrane protease [Cryobacterium sp. PH29-G1]
MGISTEATGTVEVRPLVAGSALAPAAVGMSVAMVLIVVVGSAGFNDQRLALLLGYLCVWVPLVAAVVVAGGRPGAAFWVRGLRLTLRPIDLIWGLGVGLLARTVASLIEIWGYGGVGSTGVQLGETVYDAWWVFGTLLAPVLLAPVIEEVFFRGLVLRAVHGQTMAHRATWAAAPIAVGVSGLTFALLHLMALSLSNTTTVLVVGSATLVVGLATAWLALATGRIGGAIIAHVTFNALVILPAFV